MTSEEWEASLEWELRKARWDAVGEEENDCLGARIFSLVVGSAAALAFVVWTFFKGFGEQNWTLDTGGGGTSSLSYLRC